MPHVTPEIAVDDERDPCGWGAPCEPQPSTAVILETERGGKMSVPSFVFGVWAVHRSVHVIEVITTPDPSLWCISHVPTGRSMAEFVGENDDEDAWWVVCSAVGAALNDHYVWPLTTSATSAAPSPSADLDRTQAK